MSNNATAAAPNADAPCTDMVIQFETNSHEDLRCRICKLHFEDDQQRETRIECKFNTVSKDWSSRFSHVHLPVSPFLLHSEKLISAKPQFLTLGLKACFDILLMSAVQRARGARENGAPGTSCENAKCAQNGPDQCESTL